ncbi:MAG: hypothetical protein IZT59_10905 [Verrucomicrobia bacterium]|jgi:hypothetical protein|nr:hypothetical protein [Verrucomicrobiota bacterium]|tara:strand:- start:6865 stop:7005 length:141 start_codon:yes stop_codon:yes gene_type:complete
MKKALFINVYSINGKAQAEGHFRVGTKVGGAGNETEEQEEKGFHQG